MNNIQMYRQHLDRYLDHYLTNYMKWTKSEYLLKEVKPAVVHSGRKFDRIVFQNSTMAFVAKSNGNHKGIDYKLGDVFKSATRKQPAKHVRGSIFDESYDKWNAWTGPAYMYQMESE
jgi:hypothetical protein